MLKIDLYIGIFGAAAFAVLADEINSCKLKSVRISVKWVRFWGDCFFWKVPDNFRLEQKCVQNLPV
jgi:hypothetical protein